MTECNFNFQGANFVVTGASSGIGRQITKELAAAGARVLAVARRGELLEQMHLENPLITPAVLDMTDYEKLENTIKEFTEKYGKIDGGVHAAGITDLTVLKVYDEAQVKHIMDVNYWSAVKFLQILNRPLAAQKGASFVFFSSIAVEYGFSGLFAYTSAKAALEAAVKTFAKELAPRRIRINAIRPGIVDTSMTKDENVAEAVERYVANTPLGMGKTDDISGAVMFLLSCRSRWITGSIFNVDGGYSGA